MTAAAGSNILFTSVILAKESHMLVNTMDFLYKLKKKQGCIQVIKPQRNASKLLTSFIFIVFMHNPYLHVHIMHDPTMRNTY